MFPSQSAFQRARVTKGRLTCPSLQFPHELLPFCATIMMKRVLLFKWVGVEERLGTPVEITKLSSPEKFLSKPPSALGMPSSYFELQSVVCAFSSHTGWGSLRADRTQIYSFWFQVIMLCLYCLSNLSCFCLFSLSKEMWVKLLAVNLGVHFSAEVPKSGQAERGVPATHSW